MSTQSSYSVQPYVFYPGKCEEAMEFYRKAIGAEIAFSMRYKEAPPCDPADGGPKPQMPPNWGDKIMHATMKIGGSQVMFSDGCHQQQGFEGFSLSLTVPNPAEAEKAFTALSKGGQVTMPLGKTFFSPSFGVLKDQFGVSWMVYVPGAPPK